MASEEDDDDDDDESSEDMLNKGNLQSNRPIYSDLPHHFAVFDPIQGKDL